MGLFNKLKNALFEEEEIEIPVKETIENKPTTIVKEENIPKKNIEKKEIIPEENERDLFKAENTFKFPDFDEEEFSTSYQPPIEKEVKQEPVITPKENTEKIKPISFDYNKKAKETRKETMKREVVDTPQKKTFRPSPVISPVYGVLDKNYKKEDIITVKEEKPKKKFDVDEIRRKAFGTLEEDIEKSFEKPQEEFYKTEQNIEDLLDSSVDETIDIHTRESRNSRTKLEKPSEENNIEKRSNRHQEEKVEEDYFDSTEQEENHLQRLDEEVNKSEEQKFEEDTLENDLFDLIDSMYDNREEEEE